MQGMNALTARYSIPVQYQLRCLAGSSDPEPTLPCFSSVPCLRGNDLLSEMHCLSGVWYESHVAQVVSALLKHQKATNVFVLYLKDMRHSQG